MTQPSFAEVLARPRTAPVAPRHREASPPEALDAHFHIKMPEARVTLRQYLDYPMPHHQSYPVTLRGGGGGGGVVFCWPVLPSQHFTGNECAWVRSRNSPITGCKSHVP